MLEHLPHINPYVLSESQTGFMFMKQSDFFSDVKTVLKVRDSDVRLQCIRPSIIKEILCSAVYGFFFSHLSVSN